MQKTEFIVEYKMVREHQPERLVQEVNRLIQDGWKPQGGMAIHSNSSLFFQAMVREKSRNVE